MYIWNHRSFERKGQNVDVVSSKKKTNKSSSTVSIDRHVSRRNIRSKIVARVLSFFFSSFFLFSFRFQNFDCESDEIFLFSLFLWEIADEEDYFPPSIRFHRCIFVSRFDRRAILVPTVFPNSRESRSAILHTSPHSKIDQKIALILITKET